MNINRKIDGQSVGRKRSERMDKTDRWKSGRLRGLLADCWADRQKKNRRVIERKIRSRCRQTDRLTDADGQRIE
jgi:hypothetical protein